MRPSSSSDPSAPYQAKQPVLIDFFAKEAAEQQARANANRPHSPFAELSPRGASPSNRSDAAAGSASSPVTVSTLRSFMRSKGYPPGNKMFDATIQDRLSRANLSAETLLASLEIAHTFHHPILERLGVREIQRYWLINRLSGIVIRSAGFDIGIETSARRANNNPHQFIACLLSLGDYRHH